MKRLLACGLALALVSSAGTGAVPALAQTFGQTGPVIQTVNIPVAPLASMGSSSPSPGGLTSAGSMALRGALPGLADPPVTVAPNLTASPRPMVPLAPASPAATATPTAEPAALAPAMLQSPQSPGTPPQLRPLPMAAEKPPVIHNHYVGIVTVDNSATTGPRRAARTVANTISLVRDLAVPSTPERIASASPAEAKTSGAALFDAWRAARGAAGAAAASDPGEPAPAPQPQADQPPATAAPQAVPQPARTPLLARLARSPLGRLLPSALATRLGRDPPAPQVRTEFDDDEFSGPSRLAPPKIRESAPRWVKLYARVQQKVLYGLKWGLNLAGMAALLDFTLKPALAALPWPLWLPDSWLAGTGRIELLTRFGPEAIASGVADSPLSFLLVSVPMWTAVEEFLYRGLGFGLTLLAVAALRPLAEWGTGLLKRLPDIFMNRLAQKGLAVVGWLGGKAFPIAAVLGAWSFAAAHFGAWGVDPFTIAVHLTLALALTRVAYRTRGLGAAFVAHLTYNFLMINAAFLVPMFLDPQSAAVYGLVFSILAVVFLAYQAAAHIKDRIAARRLAQTKAAAESRPRSGRIASGLAALLAAVIFSGALQQGAPLPTLAARLTAEPPAVVLVAGQPAQPPAQPGAQPAQAAPQAPVLKLQAAPAPEQAPAALEELVSRAKPAVANIIVRGTFGTATGSGFIVDRRGLLVTNAHVVESAGLGATVMVRLTDGTVVPGKVIAFNRGKDLAFIQLPPNPRGWPTLPLGESRGVREGQEVLALGFPMNNPFSVSRGIVSGTDFRSNAYYTFFQIDAAINPGNSGGPTINRRGEIIGINTFIVSRSGGSQGLGYASTVDDLKLALLQFQQTGTISQAHMGAIFNPEGRGAPSYGAWVEHVRPDSAAAKSGLKPGDILLGIEGRELPAEPKEAVEALQLLMARAWPGQTLRFLVERGGDQIEVAVTLGATEHRGAPSEVFSPWLPSQGPQAPNGR